MRLAASVLVAFVVWFSLWTSTAGSKRPSWTAKHHVRQHQRLTVIRTARGLLGVRYTYGGSSRSGIDCSGLTRFAYRSIGVLLPHLASAQERLGRYIASRPLRPGDLLFYNHGGHVALYVGGGQVIEASSARGRVIETSLREGWFTENYDQARRLIG